jgi:hypothetical protein
MEAVDVGIEFLPSEFRGKASKLRSGERQDLDSIAHCWLGRELGSQRFYGSIKPCLLCTQN